MPNGSFFQSQVNTKTNGSFNRSYAAREDGITILKRIKSDHILYVMPVIMVTANGSEYERVKGLDLGADDYIVKPFSVLELISRVKAVLRRSTPKEVIHTLTVDNLSICPNKHTVTVNNEEITLTYKEFELLHYLTKNKGMVLTRDKIMEQIWGVDFEIESRTVDMHIKTLRKKLGSSGTIIKTIRGIGYKVGDSF